MGQCKSCGDKAGFLKFECSKCKEERIEQQRLLIEKNRKLELKERQEKLKRQLQIKEWVDKFDEFTNDNFLDKDEELKLEKIKKENDIDNIDLNKLRVGITVHYEIYKELREYVENQTLPVYDKSDFLGINFMKSEAPFYSIDLGYYKEKTRTEYKGGSTGYSFRVAKGFWVRQSAFQGKPISEEYMNFEGVGTIILTNKHLYFKGDKSFRIKLNKLVDMTPHSNGIGIMRDTASAKPEFFGYGDNIDLNYATTDGVDFKINEPERQFEVFCHVASVLHDNI